ncbi:caspase family protein [Calothrix sp. PCC 7507]|uniref:caspase family protein n=1 Tax=Calothrix sp. PCC 7507 TaxID=99598 RepID=UPI00029EF9AC|nr:caspase family protein [Calothrix sp. PCC 7507]AFY35192.1 peptidase C14 caspase catalytic subunit p20 [Calothrix sp. PCC 7507]
MANYWAIVIGINQYDLFQPLRCAQADAEALKAFLVEEAGFKPQNCLLMTDTSPPIRDKSTYPTKENILLLLEDFAASSWQPQDHVWLFFSGYGINYKGNDYLMPVEGNPDLVQETGIEVRSLMQSLQLADLYVLLMLDINRAFGTQADAPVGQETIELAQELQLATILSCQPEQFSHESSELGHGFFTAALLAALNSGHGSSLTDLANYLSTLTPQLCQHHWRPTQNPVTVIPSQQQPILPYLEKQGSDRTPAKSEAAPVIFPEESFAVALAAPTLEENSAKSTPKLTKTGVWPESQGVETTVNPRAEHLKLPTSTAWIENLKSELVSQPRSAPSRSVKQQPQMLPSSQETSGGGRYIPNTSQTNFERSPKNQANASFWQQLLWWGGGCILIVSLVAIVFLRNQTRFKSQEILRTPPNAGTGDTRVINTSPNTSAPNAAAPTPVKNPPISEFAPSSQSKKRNQAVLDLAKMSLRQTQASDLNLAIATAKKIKPGEPLYEQAQENIQIWSRMILDLAEGRAQQRQYANAVAAAQLITKEADVYPKAQASINQWRLEAKQYVSNRTLLDAANGLIKPGQASTYNRAIEVAKKVPPGQPGFDMAQKSINKWSERILDIAKTRASQGDLNAAIETAALIPESTAAYEDTQEAIQKWQVRRIKK